MITLTQYQELVKRTANPLPREQALQNWALGLCGEAGEIMLHRINEDLQEDMIGELGDLLWYVFMMGHTLDEFGGLFISDDMEAAMLMDETISDGVTDVMFLISASVGRVAESVKKYTYHNKNLDTFAIESSLQDLVVCIHHEAKANNLTLPEVMQHNINKLSARHPNGFDSNHAKRTHSHPAY